MQHLRHGPNMGKDDQLDSLIRTASVSSYDSIYSSHDGSADTHEDDRAVNIHPGLEDLLALIEDSSLNEEHFSQATSRRSSLVIPPRPTPSPLQRRNAVRTLSTSSSVSSSSRNTKRLSLGVQPLTIDHSRRLSAPAHPHRSSSDPGRSPGSTTPTSSLLPSASTLHPATRPRSASDIPPSQYRSSSPSVCYSPSPTLFQVGLPTQLLASPPMLGYTESDFVPLISSNPITVPPPLTTPLGLAIPPPVFAVQAATPLTPARPHRETFDNALVEANRKRLSNLFLAQRKERRKSWTPGETKEQDGDSGMGSSGGKKPKKHWEGEIEAEHPLEDWERELRDMDAEQKMRTLEGSRRRSMEFKDFERRQRSETARQSLLGRTAAV